MPYQDSLVNSDAPLKVGEARAQDRLGRGGFSESAANALRCVDSSRGLVLSVEGAWGSGKTSVLALIEEHLQESLQKPPLIVHFNPWLIGDRDALLGQFLAKLAGAVELVDRLAAGKKLGKALMAYANAFDVIKLLPGSEPWASLAKSAFSGVGVFLSAVFNLKKTDIETRKNEVQAALVEFPRPIIVIIDDIDRLFPLEVYEMIRIIKAVGNLRNVGYVLAWDASYVCAALDKASVPDSKGYLDKIVQVRMAVPNMSPSARRRLLNAALDELPRQAMAEYFSRRSDRVSEVYFSGLRDLLEHPRDVIRVTNTMRLIEPSLRGEIVFADILGLAALKVKAPSVYDLLRKEPKLFVGALPQEINLPNQSEEVLLGGRIAREHAYQLCTRPAAVKDLVQFLFPQVAHSDGGTGGRVQYIQGHLADPTRLVVALQLGTSMSDVSLVLARGYLAEAERRAGIREQLTIDNCLGFLETLADAHTSMEFGSRSVNDWQALCVDISRIVDTPLFVQAAAVNGAISSENTAEYVINQLSSGADYSESNTLADLIIEDQQTLSVSAQLLTRTFRPDSSEKSPFFIKCRFEDKERLVSVFAANVLAAATTGALFNTANPSLILFTLAHLGGAAVCSPVFSAVEGNSLLMDEFAMALMGYATDESGRVFRMPKSVSVVEAYCGGEKLKKAAELRLDDKALAYPARAAWRAIVEEKALYGVDGTPARL